jgi:hypothetical protein
VYATIQRGIGLLRIIAAQFHAVEGLTGSEGWYSAKPPSGEGLFGGLEDRRRPYDEASHGAFRGDACHSGAIVTARTLNAGWKA